MILLKNIFAFYPYIFAELYKKKVASMGWGGGGGRERNDNISDNNSYIQILLYCMFII